jgi:iron(III) transport system ATP-binding protein
VAEFIGEANLLPATLTGYQDGVALVRLDGLTLKIPGPPLPPGPITLMARPEAIRLRQEGPGLPGVIEKVAYLGASAEYTVGTAAGPIQVSDYQVEAGLLAPGTPVRLEFLPKGLYPLPPAFGGAQGKEGPGD